MNLLYRNTYEIKLSQKESELQHYKSEADTESSSWEHIMNVCNIYFAYYKYAISGNGKTNPRAVKIKTKLQKS